MLLLPRRIYQDTRLQFTSASSVSTQIVVTGGTQSAVGRIFAGAVWFLLRRRKHVRK